MVLLTSHRKGLQSKTQQRQRRKVSHIFCCQKNVFIRTLRIRHQVSIRLSTLAPIRSKYCNTSTARSKRTRCRFSSAMRNSSELRTNSSLSWSIAKVDIILCRRRPLHLSQGTQAQQSETWLKDHRLLVHTTTLWNQSTPLQKYFA